MNVGRRDCLPWTVQELKAVTLAVDDPERHQLCSEFIEAAVQGLGAVLDRDIVAAGGVGSDETIAAGTTGVDEVNPAVGFVEVDQLCGDKIFACCPDVWVAGVALDE